MIPGREIKIGDKVYVMPALTLGMLELYQDRIDAFQKGEVSSKSWTTVIDVVHGALKRNYPDMDRSIVTDNLELRDIGGLFEKLMDVSGVDADRSGKVTAGQ